MILHQKVVALTMSHFPVNHARISLSSIAQPYDT